MLIQCWMHRCSPQPSHKVVQLSAALHIDTLMGDSHMPLLRKGHAALGRHSNMHVLLGRLCLLKCLGGE